MPYSAYTFWMGRKGSARQPPLVQREDKPLAWLAGELKTPPMSSEARVEGGMLLAPVAAGRNARHAGVQTHAVDRRALSRAADRRHHAEKLVANHLLHRERRDRGARRVAKETRTTPVDVIKNCKRRLAAFKSRDEP